MNKQIKFRVSLPKELVKDVLADAAIDMIHESDDLVAKEFKETEYDYKIKIFYFGESVEVNFIATDQF